jgi:hypothetical protein
MRHEGSTTVTIQVEYEGRNALRDDLTVREKITVEQIDQCKFDLVCHITNKLRKMIDDARAERENDQ